ncbi:4'-phosphopantetheinyl transferase family protein [Sphaerisporangium dianthi]|uniref:4'-phosphopantetheinyl transferase family protein n=1 Tax=Sphaerisporangium dianthi TaxID=1436120 RepID=A0ABV9CLI0_9ACTN
MRWLARAETDVPAGGDWLSAAEAKRAGAMRFSKRRTEYLTARWTAKQALRRYPPAQPYPASAGLAELEVRNRPSGAPEAYAAGRPLPVGISLTDRAGWAVCLLTAGPEAIGCDLELVEPRSAAFVADCFTSAEGRFAGGDHLRANLVWSAKESALKVLGTGLRKDTRSVEVTVAGGRDPGEPGDGDGNADGWGALTVRTTEGTVMHGWWRRFGAFVLTVAADRPVPVPVSLEDPPALASATPAHTWLTRPENASRAGTRRSGGR